MVRQEEYRIGKARRRLKRRLTKLQVCMDIDAPEYLVLRCWRLAKRARLDIKNIVSRAHHVHLTCFNLNIYSEEQALHDFRFRKQDIGKICVAMGWTAGRTKRNRCGCDPVTACCVVLRRLSSATNWYDLDPVFGMRHSHLSEVLWEVVETFVESKGHLLTKLNSVMLESRAHYYEKCIPDAGAPLDICIGFIDCTKIQISRPGGNGSNQRARYSGHKRIHCLVYQTITTPDGLIFSLYGPDVTTFVKEGSRERPDGSIVYLIQ